MTVFACNPDESAGFSEKVCRYVVYECWQDVVAEIAECETKEAIGTMLVQLADDRAEIDSPAKVMALWDRLEERWITGHGNDAEIVRSPDGYSRRRWITGTP